MARRQSEKYAKRIRHVAILIETSRSYGRLLLQGVRRYFAEHEPWSVFIESRSMGSRVPPWLKTWEGDGILSRTNSQTMADVIRATNVPTVELHSNRFHRDTPYVGVDDEKLGQIVAEHLLERGFRSFGIYGITTTDYYVKRCDNFVNTVRAAGCECELLEAPGSRETPRNWERHQDKLVAWVHGLEKPVGVMACTDQFGFWLLDACYRAGVAVPEELAVVGIGNDETLCTMARPPLSSVNYHAEETGYQAAALLDEMMDRKTKTSPDVLIKPLGIVTRRSSDIVAIENEELAEALQFIRENACNGITVDNVLEEVQISRSSFERQMRAVLNRSPKAEIRRVQLNYVKELLQHTRLSLSMIAVKTGFKHPRHMSEVFRREIGILPTQFRDEAQGKAQNTNR